MSGRVAGMLVGILWGAMLSPAAAQSLADVARQESARRGQLKTSGKVLTNADLPASAVVDPAPARSESDPATEGDATSPAAEGGAAARTAASGATADGSSPSAAPKADEPKDDEQGWRERAGRTAKAVAEAQAQVRQLRALLDRLGLESYASDPAIAARAKTERETIRAQVADAEAKAVDARAAREAFEREARAAGVPPAWIQ